MTEVSKKLDKQQNVLLRHMALTARTISELATKTQCANEQAVRHLIDRARKQGHDIKCIARRTFIFMK